MNSDHWIIYSIILLVVPSRLISYVFVHKLGLVRPLGPVYSGYFSTIRHFLSDYPKEQTGI